MKGKTGKLFYIIVLAGMLLTGCSGQGKQDDGYVRYDSASEPFRDGDTGGNDVLTLTQGEKTITIENEKVRVVFNDVNGSVREYVNKETGQYLVRDAAANTPFVANYYNREVNAGAFSCSVTEDTEDQKEVEFIWTIRNDTKIVAHARLAKGSDTVCFDVAVRGNRYEDFIVSVEYPVFNGIKALSAEGNDQFISPVATGYVFENPAQSFNSGTYDFSGVTKAYGMYPSGWECPMQFMAYLTENLGGFYIGTTDGGCTIKSFTFYSTGKETLRAGVHHFLDDVAEENVTFDYEVQVSNLTKGYWQEAGDRYFSFAKDQEWTKKGTLEERDDINRRLYEDTVLVNFGIAGNRTDTPGNSISEYAAEQRKRLYSLYTDTLKGNLFNIYLNYWQRNHISNEFNSSWETFFPGSVDEGFQRQIFENGDQMLLFEFNTLYNANYQTGTEENALWKSRAIQAIYGGKETFTWTTENDFREWWYVCPSVKEWIDFCMEKDKEILSVYGANGLYHDVGTAADSPFQCFDSSHAHGTRVNIIPDYIEIERLSKELSNEYGQFSVGQELIYEQLLPYVDFFQARANGGLLSWMESDRFRDIIEAGYAVKIPLFDYVYHAYGGLRVDGFMMPYEELGDGYYHAMAYTVLNGGLPEYNYEFTDLTDAADRIHMPYLEFLNELGQARTGYGKEFLVYGRMRKGPVVSKETVSYEYLNSNVVLRENILQGTAVFDRVISSAFEHNGKTAVFLMNIAEEDMTVNFILEAERLYGVAEGSVEIFDRQTGDFAPLSDIRRGEAKCSVELPSRKVVMLIINQ